MENPKPLTNLEGEVRELTENELSSGIAFSDLPKNLQKKLEKIQIKSTSTYEVSPK
ncbi:MAG: hypothetical protein VKJ02_12070 [Snowella sp.]|nr:hypothetical protein [Snowella sp.]